MTKRDPATCLMKKSFKFKFPKTVGGKCPSLQANLHETCAECDETTQETCLKDGLKAIGKDFSQYSVFINIKPTGNVEQVPNPEQTNTSEVKEETPAIE